MIKHFYPLDLADYLKDNPAVVLDVREQWEYNICHLKNSVLMPMNQIPNKLDELDKHKEYVIVCHHGVRSLHIAKYLHALGFEKLINLDGGINRWAEEVDKSMTSY